jgi:hypothetical protein
MSYLSGGIFRSPSRFPIPGVTRVPSTFVKPTVVVETSAVTVAPSGAIVPAANAVVTVEAPVDRADDVVTPTDVTVVASTGSILTFIAVGAIAFTAYKFIKGRKKS